MPSRPTIGCRICGNLHSIMTEGRVGLVRMPNRSRIGSITPVGAVTLLALSAACSRKPDRILVAPETGSAAIPYSYPIVNPVDSTIGFDYAQLLRVSREPLQGHCVESSGPYNYQFIDSCETFWLMGWNSPAKRRALSYPIFNAAWTPDGKSIIFNGESGITSLRLSGDSLDEDFPTYYNLGGSFFGPKLNPKMTKLAVYGTVGWERGVWVWDSGTNDFYKISDDGSEPDWSPDGRALVFHGYVGQNDALLMADTLGNGATTIAQGFTYLASPAFSPDGRRVAFIARTGSNDFQVWTVGTDGKGLAQITTDGAGAAGLAWTPSGHDIVYVHYRWSEYTCSGGSYPAGTIWRVDPGTRQEQQITFNTGVQCP